MRSRAKLVVAITLLIAPVASPCLAQESRSAPLVAELHQLMTARKLDAMAAALPGSDRFVAASEVPGLGLLVLSARSTAADYLADCIRRKQYKDAYSYLNGTAIADGKLFIQDAGADGLQPARQRDGAAFDISYQNVVSEVRFDGAPAGQHMTDAKYREAFSGMDAEYVKLLSLLIEEAKKGDVSPNGAR